MNCELNYQCFGTNYSLPCCFFNINCVYIISCKNLESLKISASYLLFEFKIFFVFFYGGRKNCRFIFHFFARGDVYMIFGGKF